MPIDRGDRSSSTIRARRAHQSRHPLRRRQPQHLGLRRRRGARPDRGAKPIGSACRSPIRSAAAPHSTRWSTLPAGVTAEHGRASRAGSSASCCPGLGFKAVVIGGGYATGRELAEFFLPSGPWGGLAAIALATAAVQPVLRRSPSCSRAATGTRRLSELLQAACSGPAGSLFELRLPAVRGPDPRRLRRRRGRDRRGGVRRCRTGRHARPDGRHRRASSTFGNTVGRAAVRAMSPICSTASTPCSSCSPSSTSATGSRRGFRGAPRRPPGWALGGTDLRQLQLDRRGRHPAGRAPPDQQPRRRHRRRRSPARWRCCPACSSSSAWSPSIPTIGSATLPSDFCCSASACRFPPAVPADDLLRPARKRRERGPCHQRAHRPGLAARAAACR